MISVINVAPALRILRAGAWLLCLALCGVAAGARAETTPPVMTEPMEELASRAFWWADFDELERLYAQAGVPGKRTPDGRGLLTAFRVGVGRVFFTSNNDSAAYFDQLVALTRQWSHKYSQSHLAQALHARALLARALQSRGTAYSSQVTPQAWAGFEKYVRLALEHLAAHPEALANDSTANVYLMLIGRWAGWPNDKLAQIAALGLARWPDEYAFDHEMIIALLPKWGGSAQAIDRYVTAATQRVGPDQASELYARLYLEIAWEFEGGLFTQSRADWGKMKKGFLDMLARYPDASNFNQFARVACIAQDKPAVREALEKIGPAPDYKQWGRGSQGRNTYETCKQWAHSSEPTPGPEPRHDNKPLREPRANPVT